MRNSENIELSNNSKIPNYTINYNNKHTYLFNVREVADQHLDSNFRSHQHELPAAEHYFH